MSFSFANRALPIYILHADGVIRGVPKSHVVRPDQPTVRPRHRDLTWLGVVLCICSAAVTCGGAYQLIDNLF
jgi:hypothetical protein